MQKKLSGIDTTAVLLLSALVGTALIYFGYFTPWEFGVWVFVLKGLLWVEVVRKREGVKLGRAVPFRCPRASRSSSRSPMMASKRS
jgi:hypothetical protein